MSSDSPLNLFIVWCSCCTFSFISELICSLCSFFPPDVYCRQGGQFKRHSARVLHNGLHICTRGSNVSVADLLLHIEKENVSILLFGWLVIMLSLCKMYGCRWPPIRREHFQQQSIVFACFLFCCLVGTALGLCTDRSFHNSSVWVTVWEPC